MRRAYIPPACRLSECSDVITHFFHIAVSYRQIRSDVLCPTSPIRLFPTNPFDLQILLLLLLLLFIYSYHAKLFSPYQHETSRAWLISLWTVFKKGLFGASAGPGTY